MTSRVYSQLYEGLSDEGKKRYRAKLDFVGPDVADPYTYECSTNADDNVFPEVEYPDLYHYPVFGERSKSRNKRRTEGLQEPTRLPVFYGWLGWSSGRIQCYTGRQKAICQGQSSALTIRVSRFIATLGCSRDQRHDYLCPLHMHGWVRRSLFPHCRTFVCPGVQVKV